MKVLIPTALDLDVPQAPVARMRALQRAVRRMAGNDLDVLPLGRAGDGPRSPSRLARLLGGLAWRRDGMRTLRDRLRQEEPDAVLLVDIDPLFVWLAGRECRAAGVPFFVEVTEVPEEVLGGGVAGRFGVAVYWATVKRAVGVLAISRYLEDEVRGQTARPTLVVPGYVDVAEFSSDAVEPDVATVMYAGSLSEAKDGVRALITAFGQAVDELGVVARLRILSGGFSEHERDSVDEVIARGAGEGVVSVEGPYPRAEIPRLLSEASILALPRPASRQAEGGFPTKLGEYLASGRPVVATRVGAVKDVLQDGVDALVVEPGDPDQLVGALKSLLSSGDERRRIGRAGRDLAERVLNVDAHAARVLTFLGQETNHG